MKECRVTVSQTATAADERFRLALVKTRKRFLFYALARVVSLSYEVWERGQDALPAYSSWLADLLRCSGASLWAICALRPDFRLEVDWFSDEAWGRDGDSAPSSTCASCMRTWFVEAEILRSERNGVFAVLDSDMSFSLQHGVIRDLNFNSDFCDVSVFQKGNVTKVNLRKKSATHVFLGAD